MRSGDWNFTTTEIRKLFRSFDTNNDHSLQHSEFQHGMTLMGLQAASDPYAFSRIVEEVDQDQVGYTAVILHRTPMISLDCCVDVIEISYTRGSAYVLCTLVGKQSSTEGVARATEAKRQGGGRVAYSVHFVSVRTNGMTPLRGVCYY